VEVNGGLPITSPQLAMLIFQSAFMISSLIVIEDVPLSCKGLLCYDADLFKIEASVHNHAGNIDWWAKWYQGFYGCRNG
jgi:hypothetical protein